MLGTSVGGPIGGLLGAPLGAAIGGVAGGAIGGKIGEFRPPQNRAEAEQRRLEELNRQRAQIAPEGGLPPLTELPPEAKAAIAKRYPLPQTPSETAGRERR